MSLAMAGRKCRQSDPPGLTPRPKAALALRRAIRVAFGVVLGLLIAETLARVTSPPNQHDPFAHNPIIKKQADQVDLFERDAKLGHRLKGGSFVGVYSPGLVFLKQIIEDPRRKGRIVVLNLGDSSTSGWDSDVIEENAERLKRGKKLRSPFQGYKTYSDILAEDSRLYVINAGVPGFSSLQGARYLRRLLDEFKRVGVHVDVVTVYFGNNDSAWNGNIKDRYQLPESGLQLHLLRVVDQAAWWFRVVTRVTASEYAGHIREIIGVCREAGVHVIPLEPVVQRVWQPGLRTRVRKDEVEKLLTGLRGTEVKNLLVHAQELFSQGMRALSAGEIDRARQLLEQAREEDYIVPRIKEGHMRALHEVADREGVTLVSVKEKVPLNDSAFFRDYCHPVDPANRLFADALMAIIRGLRSRHL